MTTPPFRAFPRAPSLPNPAAVARDQLRRARWALDPELDAHEVRRALKRARALARLCRDGFDTPEDAKALQRLLRDAGRELSAIRDRDAALEVLDGLGEDLGLRPLGSRGGTIGGIEGGSGGNGERARAEQARGLIEQATGILQELPPVERGAAIREVGHAYRRARSAFLAARRSPTAEALHTLRKRGKDLRYQLDWLTPLWPGVLGGQVQELHSLSDEIGRVQDVRVLRRLLEGGEDAGERRRLARALWSLRLDSRRARRSALERGGRLFDEDPEAFAARMVRLGAL